MGWLRREILQETTVAVLKQKALHTARSTHFTHLHTPSHSTLLTHPTPHSIVLTRHCKLYPPLSRLHTLHFRLHTLHSTLHTLYFKLRTVHSTLYTLHSTLPTPCSTLHALHLTDSHQAPCLPHKSYISRLPTPSQTSQKKTCLAAFAVGTAFGTRLERLPHKSYISHLPKPPNRRHFAHRHAICDPISSTYSSLTLTKCHPSENDIAHLNDTLGLLTGPFWYSETRLEHRATSCDPRRPPTKKNRTPLSIREQQSHSWPAPNLNQKTFLKGAHGEDRT